MALTLEELNKDWLEKLIPRLNDQANAYRKYEAYYDGAHKQSFSTEGYRQEFDGFLKAIVDNWMPIVVDAVQERMAVTGFRFGEDEGDKDARDIWQVNSMDTESELLHTAALIGGTASALVWVDETRIGDDFPLITIEDPTQMYVAVGANGRRLQRVAAIKVWCDEWTAEDRANVYLPDALYKIIKVNDKWQPFEKYVYANPLGVVPVVPFYNRATMKAGSCRSELQDVTATQDQINKILCDAMVASEFSAFAQRWVTGMEIEKDGEGKPINPFESGADRLFAAENDLAKFGQFDSTDLTNYVKFMENRIQSIASRSRTPAHYLLGSQGSFPSGESLKATETGLVQKIKQRCRHYGESWEEVMRLAFAVAGDEAKAGYFNAEVMWADVESRTEAEHVDALVKLRTLDVPLRQLWEDAGYSPAEIERFLEWAKDEAMVKSLAQPAQLTNVRVNGGSSVSPITSQPASATA
jgi:hypothetical protein